MNEAETILQWWFSPESQARWFASTAEFDQACKDRAGALLDRAAAGELDDWAKTPRGALALIIILDQIPRNIFRGTAQAFSFDEKAREQAKAAVDAGFDQQLATLEKTFMYLPFEHSEDLSDQERSVALFKAMGADLQLDYAIRHHVIVERFGRFPHRNKALGRESTEEEIEFLKQPDSSF